MLCVSINYKKADADTRGKFAFDENLQNRILDMLSEGVILCTCSRTEIYCSDHITPERVSDILTEVSGVNDIKVYAMFFENKNAVNHLFRVACGMDSMVIGEDEILGQVRESYKRSCSMNAVSGELNVIFQAALACAKKIKTDTSLSGVPVSTATLAANEAVKWGGNILMIGASGKIGSSTVKNILAHKDVNVTVTARKHIPDIKSDRVNIIPYEDRYSYTDNADCIISATSSPVYTLTADRISQSIHTEKKRLFIDLAVPHDIDEKISSFENAKLIDIDFFESLAKSNNEIKLSAREKAEAIIASETDTLLKNMMMQKYLAYSEKTDCAVNENDLRMIYKLKSELDWVSFKKVIDVLIGE